jgi:hypothetical protein
MGHSPTFAYSCDPLFCHQIFDVPVFPSLHSPQRPKPVGVLFFWRSLRPLIRAPVVRQPVKLPCRGQVQRSLEVAAGLVCFVDCAGLLTPGDASPTSLRVVLAGLSACAIFVLSVIYTEQDRQMISRVPPLWMARWRPARPGLTSYMWCLALALVYRPCFDPTPTDARSGNSVRVLVPDGHTRAL